MDCKEFGNYLVSKDGTVTLNGKLVASGRMYVNREWHNGIDIADKLFASPVKDKVSSTPVKTVIKEKKASKLPHGNKGRKHTAESIAKMKLTDRKGKAITFNGVEYDSINECARLLGVTRQTIYRRLKA